MLSTVGILSIMLLSVMVIGQVVFILKVLTRANAERISLIQLHKQHLKIVEEQRDLYRELLDTLIEKQIIDDNHGQECNEESPKEISK